MAIFKAIKSGDANEVMRLLNTNPSLLEGVNVWAAQMTPLIHAARAGQLEIVKLLTGKGADIHATTSYAETALHCAAAHGHEEVVAYLLDNGAQASQLDYNGNTPLMLAVRVGRPRVVVVALRLLNHMGGQGLEASCQSEGCSALNLAVRGGRTELVALLLNHGARADTTSRSGKSALQRAVERGRVEIVKLLVDRLGPQALHEGGPSRGSLLHIALGALWMMSEEDMVMYLLSKGPSPTVTNSRGETALMCGARWASMKVVRRLLEQTAGQGLNDRSNDGRTALHYAVLRDRHENVRVLLLAGADPTIVDDLQRTPRMLAQQGTTHRRSVEVFKVRECIRHAV
jgi:ankyrin repeat protein